MGRIFAYEIKRLILSKLFIALLIINGVFAWYVLSVEIIMGVAFTAPFSAWSFAAYMAAVMPFAVSTALLLMGFYFSKNELLAKQLTSATPINNLKYTLVRYGVIVIGFIIICLVAITLSVIFYSSLFGFSDYSEFLLPGAITILPGFVFFVGFGSLAGRLRPGVLYVLIPAVILLGFGVTPIFLDVFGGGYYGSAPLELPVGIDGEPEFMLSTMFIVSRIVYFAAGATMWIFGLRVKKNS